MITIENEFLSVSIEETGAQLKRIFSKKTQTEYLWQGDPAYWTGRAYNLFPIIGRLHEGKYDLYGKTYEMQPHGLIRRRMLKGEKHSVSSCVFTFVSDEETLASYPYDFVYSIEYSLKGACILMTVSVLNKSKQTMYFAIGGHPGFSIPFDGGAFEDYAVFFPKATSLKWHKFSENILMSGEVEDYPLMENKLSLRHSLFGLDAIVLEGSGGVAEIARAGGTRKIVVNYPSMDFVGVWHKPKSDAPFICIEPWSTLPARDGVREDFAKKSDFLSARPNEKHQTVWSIEVKE
ncbi:MAG: aldose 1-epimerase family protein [Clostridia bacterium]|nr:aldose 1-epimerase family protein [Clostridia bacterium]